MMNLRTAAGTAFLLGLFCYVPNGLAASDSYTVIEEVIVTATKRAESIQDVPIAITALDAQTLERAGVKDLRDLSTVASSFNMNSSQTESQGSTLRIRGVGTTGNNIGLESAVGVFIDGVYQSRPGIALGDLLDVEAIEVLRGPQGTLFGRNTSAGALNIRTLKPNHEETEWFTNVSFGNFDAYNIQAGVSAPLTDTLAFRLSGAVRERDGFQESATGADTRNRDRYLLRGQLSWDVSDALNLRFIADYADAKERCCDGIVLTETPATAAGAFTAAGLPANGGVVFSGQSALDNLKSNAEQFTNPNDQWGFSVEANYEINDSTTLTYIGSYRDFYASSVQADFVGIGLYEVGTDRVGGEAFDELTTITQELRIAGTSERVDWLVGFFYSDEEIEEVGTLGLLDDYTAYMDAMLWNFNFNALGLTPALPLLGGVPLATGGTFGDVLAASSPTLAFAGGSDFNGAFARNIYKQDGQSWSIFTHNTFHLTNALDIVVGLRWTDEEKDGSFKQSEAQNDACFNTIRNAGALAAGAAGTGLEAVAGGVGAFSVGFGCFPFATPADAGFPTTPVTFDDSFEDDELIYTGKAVYRFTDLITGYISFTHGFKAGGFNLDSTAAIGGASPSFNSEIIDAWEIGLKTDLFDRRVRANFSIFDYDIEDFQVLEFTGIQFETFNVPNAQSKGFEADILALPTEWLTLSFGYTYADSNYPNNCQDPKPRPPANPSLCGQQFTNAPENVLTFGVNYDQTLANDLAVFASLNGRWEDDRRTGTRPGRSIDIQDANTKMNLRVGLGDTGGTWSVELWGNNITDEQTYNVGFAVPLRTGSEGVFAEAPRTYGMTFRVRQ